MEITDLPNINDLLGFGSTTVAEEKPPAPETPKDEKASEEKPETPESREETDEETPVEEIPLVEEIRQMIGLGEEASYEDTPEGIVRLVRDSSDQLAKTQLDRLFEQFPLVQRLLEYQLNGGDESRFLQTFFPPADYDSLELKEDALDLQERVLRDELQRQGYGESEILEEIEEAKSNGRLFKKAERALEALRKHHRDSREKLLQEQKAQAEEEEKQREGARKSVQEKIRTASELRGIPLPEKDKKAFEDYLFKPVDGGYSQYQVDLASIDPEVELASALLLFRKYDLSGFIRSKAQEERAKSLRERLKEQKEPSLGEVPGKNLKPKNVEAVVENLNPAALFGN